MAIALTAANVPLPMSPGSALSLSGTPPVISYPVTGDFASGAAAKIQKAAVHSTLIARYGSGCYGVCYGLVISISSGLTLAYTAGEALIDGIVEKAAGTMAISPSITGRVWLNRDGTFTVRTDTAQPANPAVFLGTVTTSGVAITNVDTSGVLNLIGGVGVRQTADTGKPGDTPGSTQGFYTQTTGELWYWNGFQYLKVPYGGRKSTAMTDANKTLAASEYKASILELTGALTAGRNIVLPIYDGLEYTVYNGTTGGFALTFIGATGTGIAVAATKRARIYCDGTNWVRASADV